MLVILCIGLLIMEKIIRKHLIVSVMKNSISHKAGIQPGDMLVAIDGRPVEDILDYRMADSAENLVLTVEKPDGSQEDVHIEKFSEDFLGLGFEDDLLDTCRNCANKCIFCFVDQLPNGMRESLYFKDDDWRLSLMMGNYITLTNLSDKEIERIIRLKVSPLYISVHAADPHVRAKMMSNPNAGALMDILLRFKNAGIRFHCQIVLCPGINDGNVLQDTVERLAALHPNCCSVAVVPVGLTAYRRGLYELQPLSKEDAVHCIEQINALSEVYKKRYGTAFVFAADEMYIKAELPLPDYDSYEGFEQIENGVGLMAKLEYEFDEALNELPPSSIKREVSLVCGVSAEAFINRLARKAVNRFAGLKVNVYAVKNDFFGHSITVTGLLTGRDILNALKGKRIGDELLISKSTLREGTEIFLDDMTVQELSKSLNKPVRAVFSDGWALAEALVTGSQGENI